MNRCIIINPFTIGDVIFSLPIVRAVKDCYPGCRIGYMCQRRFAELLQPHPLIDELYFFITADMKRLRRHRPVAYLKTVARGVWRMARAGFDVAIDLSLQPQYGYWLRWIGVAERWGFDYQGSGRYLTHPVPFSGYEGRHVVDFYGELLKSRGIDSYHRGPELFVSTGHARWAEDFLRAAFPADERPLIALAPLPGGSSWGAKAYQKYWPFEYLAETGRRLIGELDARLVLIGTAEDRSRCERLRWDISAAEVLNAGGLTSLGQCAALLQRCRVFLGADSGPLHMAAALGVACVGIYGATDETVYGPVSARAVTVRADSGCRPCYRKFRSSDCRTVHCLHGIDSRKVFAAVERMLRSPVVGTF